MRAYLPVATDGGEPIEGLLRSDFVVRQPAFGHSLGDRGHIPYAVVNPDDPRNTLTVRDAPAGGRTVISRDAWEFGRLEGGLRVGNHNDYTWFLRSLLLKLDDWTKDGTLPPESRYPQVANRTLVELEVLKLPQIPRVRRPVHVSRAYRLNYGPEFETLGIISIEPPEGDTPFPFLVPQVDETGNEIAGIRSPELAVPLATHAGWNPFSPISSQGSYIPLARTRNEREAAGDSRLSVEERYTSREQYLGLVAGEALSLIEDGYLLGGDLAAILQRAGMHWDYVMGD